MSLITSKRYRAKYNKEIGIKEKSGKKGRTWKLMLECLGTLKICGMWFTTVMM
ncbi:MAG: hypothetical protein LBC85_10240 [Fibromonadaceae bacterium]|jgi:hypothetical protein|nr:hypothetical protein [Fibromonadaceae bacterium]